MSVYYEDGLVRLYHADCSEVLPSLSGVDLVFTSPPYNLGTHPSGKGSGMHAGSGYSANGKTWTRVADLAGGYEGSDDGMPQADYDLWQADVVRALWSALSERGAIFYNHKPRPMNGVVKLPTDYGAGLPLRQVIIWDRGVGMNFSQSHFLPKCEWIMVWAKPAFRLRTREHSALGDVWSLAPESDTLHPAPFPLGLPARAIEAVGPSLVLDPFAGSGTTLRAAKDASVKAIGIESSERYCELAVARLAQEAIVF